MEGSEVLRDRYGSRIGEIQTIDSKQVLRDKYGSRLGEYDPQTNRTTDQYGRLVGSGNLLVTFFGSVGNHMARSRTTSPTFKDARNLGDVPVGSSHRLERSG